MRGLLRTLGLTALLAGSVLANEVELVRIVFHHNLRLDADIRFPRRHKMKPIDSVVRECIVAKLGVEVSIPSS